jgi:hypothetical protein
MPQTGISSIQQKWLGEGQYASTRARSVDGAVQQAIANGFIPYGRVAVLNTSTNRISALNGAPANDAVLVIPILVERYGMSLAEAYADPATGDLGYPDGAMVEYITEGDVVMWSENGGTIGGAVHFRHTAAAAPNNKLGRIRNAAVADQTDTRGSLRFAETRSGAGLIAVRVMTSVGL